MATKSNCVDWNNGCWANAAAPQAGAQVLISSDWAPIRAFDPIVAGSPEAVYGDVLPVLRRADLRITNLECPLVARGKPSWKSGSTLAGRPAHIRGLTAVPFEIVTLANNHVFDYGAGSFRGTMRLLREHGVQTVGAGMSAEEARRPLVVDVKGIAIGIINFSEGEDLTDAASGPGVFGWDVGAVVDAVRAIRAKVDVALVIFHGGVEYIACPPPYVAQAFCRIADAGADLIIGHHPHVPQGIQIHHGAPLCYSLGNFVFYQETDLKYRKIGYLVEAGVAKKSLASIRVIPYAIRADRLSLLRGREKARFFRTLQRVSRTLADKKKLEAAWHGFLRYYGVKGFQKEIKAVMDRIAVEPQKGAAMFRNRIIAAQHRRHWIDALTRIIDQTIDTAPQWAYDLAQEWLTVKKKR